MAPIDKTLKIVHSKSVLKAFSKVEKNIEDIESVMKNTDLISFFYLQNKLDEIKNTINSLKKEINI